MYNLDEAFENLRGVLDQNLTSEVKDFWNIYFHFWRYLYSLNQNIEECSRLEDKVDLIEQFVRQNKEIAKLEEAMIERNKLPKKDIPSPDTIPFSPHIQSIKDLFLNEQARLARLMKEVKREKKAPSKSALKTRKKSVKQRWVRS